MRWWQMFKEEVLKEFNVNSERGLSSFESKKRAMRYGKNVLTDEKKNTFWKKLGKQLSDFMVITLLVSAVISFIVSHIEGSRDYIDALIILFIVVLNTVIGILQERRAEKAIDSLKRLSSPYSKVVRDGKGQKIPSEDLVPGDILILRTGDLIGADARIIESSGLFVEESAITGESFSISKSEDKLNISGDTLAERKNMLFAGSVITRGHGQAVVTETGMKTEVGKIAGLINEEKSFRTPLSARLASTGKIIGIFIILISVVVFILGIMQNVDFIEMFMISISLAVAAIPEGLPAVVTIVLAGGVQRLAARNTIVRNLPAVETLGHTAIICSDKTGTLTMNKMVVEEIKSVGKVQKFTSQFGHEMLTLGTLCNNSIFLDKNSETSVRGEPTENALLLASIKSGISKRELEEEFKRVHEIPFNSTRKLMTTVHSTKSDNYKVVTKGALDVVIKKCTHYKSETGIHPIDEHVLKEIESYNEEMSSRALRVIAISYKDISNLSKDEKFLESELIFCGLIGIADPIRPEAKSAVNECKRAGIKPVMITGDHAYTAETIARSLGILDENSKVMTGAELNRLSEEELAEIINSYSVFARVSPAHKVKIVKAFQKSGAVVAMTGDGVNDAPALKAADIGCAMGKSGTDAAKSAADMVMADDNFATIVEAIRQGRGMFDNIKKTIHFLLSTNIGEVMVVLFAFLIRVPTPLLAVHLLWINMVTDAFPALALGVDPIDSEIMRRPPLNPKKSLFSGGMGYNIVLEGCFIAAVGFLSYTIGRVFFDIDPQNPIIGRTMAFLTLGLSQLMHAFNVQSNKSLFVTGIFNNLKLVYSVIFCVILQLITVTVPSLNGFFKTQPLNFIQWIIVVFLAISPLLISEFEKYFWKVKLQKSKKNSK